MTQELILPFVDSRATLENVGGKAASLSRLSAANLPVPGGFYVTTAAYREFVDANDLQTDLLAALEGADIENPATLERASRRIQELFENARMLPAVASAIVQAYNSLPGMDPAVAVRSSATAEDLPEASFAGQQDTYLNVSGAQEVLQAVRKCWASLWTARAIGYRIRQNIAPEQIALAVVVQLLVPAEAAGVLFTVDPVTGKRDRVVISASWGLGEAVVGGLVTPDMLIIDKQSGQVIERQTACKEVMTSRINGGTKEEPVAEDLRRAPVLGDEAAAELARLGVQIEQLYEMPVDIEWALSDGKFAILQARPVTALAETQPDTSLDWQLPEPDSKYMRSSIIDLMPDPLSPLFATMGLAEINSGMQRLVKEVFNAPPESLHDETILTINGYAFMKVNFTARQWWLMISRMAPTFPRMIRTGVRYWREVAHPDYAATVKRWQEKPAADLLPSQIMLGIHEVLEATVDHLGALMAGTMGTSAGSEGLFTNVYEKLVRRAEDPPAPVFLVGFDSIPIQAEKTLFDMALWCREQGSLAAHIVETSTEEIIKRFAHKEPPPGVDSDIYKEWRRRFGGYLDNYGYAVYNLDFATSLPMDDPTAILETLKMFIAGKGKNPYERQGASTGRRQEAVGAVQDRLKGLGIKRWAFRKSLKWAQSLAPLREDGLAEIGLGYPQLRRLFAELGDRFARAGAMQDAGDIYWLEESELEQLVTTLDRGIPIENMAARIAERKTLWQAQKRKTPPPQLPPMKKYMGFNIEAFTAVHADEQVGDIIKGLGASPGTVTGTARVIHGAQDFGQMQPGDILIATSTTPAWTPLFTMAAAVVTDIGGPLSHGSIVAREYGIPAVMGTGVATQRIRSGQSITVDGSAGTVTLNIADEQ